VARTPDTPYRAFGQMRLGGSKYMFYPRLWLSGLRAVWVLKQHECITGAQCSLYSTFFFEFLCVS